MKLIIDIPDKKYNEIKEFPLCYTEEVFELIRKGTPLPKGHGRLIDADAYIDMCEEGGWLDDIIVNDFNNITPTIIEADKGE